MNMFYTITGVNHIKQQYLVIVMKTHLQFTNTLGLEVNISLRFIIECNEFMLFGNISIPIIIGKVDFETLQTKKTFLTVRMC